MELSAITDESWRRHVNAFKPVDMFAVDDYLFELYVIDEIGYSVNYLYRLLCYKEGIEAPILSLNTEFGPAYVYFHSATVGDNHLNFDFSAQTETLEQFRAWAIDQLHELLPHIDKSKLAYVQNKGLQLSNIKYLSEFELKRMQKYMSQLLELSNEFMFPIHFEESDDRFETFTISILNVKLLVMETKRERHIGAILFPKKEFTEESITKWLFCYGVYYGRQTGGPLFVDQCSNVLFSFLQDGYVLVIYLKGKERKQVQHIYDTARHQDKCDAAFFAELDARVHKSIYIEGKQVSNDTTIELEGEVNVVFINGMTLYGDRIVLKDGNISIMKRDQNVVIAQLEQFYEMHIEIGEVEYNPKVELRMQCCFIEYERTI